MNTDFLLGQAVNIAISNRSGTVIGIATYTRTVNQYQVEYVDGKGDVTTSWFYKEELQAT